MTLDMLRAEVSACQKCGLCAARKQAVFGDGNENAVLMFVGEGPGEQEDNIGIPFVGAAGHLLDDYLLAVGIRREDVYIANIVKCRPPNNRTPENDEINCCIEYLKKQIMLIKPKIIVLLGNTALKSVFGEEYSITKSRGIWLEKKGIKYLPTYHPAALLRDESKKIDFWNDLKQII